MAIKSFFALMRKTNTVYEKYFETMVRKNGMNSTSFQVLMFFADNPEYNTARDLCRMRSMKTGIVSVAIEQLTVAGLLERKNDPSDRRIQRLYLTEQALPVVEEGRALRQRFFQRLQQGMTEEEFKIYFELTMKLQSTVEEMAQEML